MSQLLHIDNTPPIAPLPTKPQAAPTFFVDELQDLATVERFTYRAFRVLLGCHVDDAIQFC